MSTVVLKGTGTGIKITVPASIAKTGKITIATNGKLANLRLNDSLTTVKFAA